MKARNITLVILLAVALVQSTACKKYLQEKSVLEISKPESLNDLQQLLDNPSLSLGLTMDNTATDEVYIDESLWSAVPEIYSKGYVWDPAVQDEEDWVAMYNIVYYTNNVLFNLEQMGSVGTEKERNNIKGAALFMRAHAFYQVAQIYTKQYDAKTANVELGIPLRLNANLNEKSVRSSLQQTYDQIINDLKEGTNLLPETSLKTRPSKASCFGLLARIFLQQGEYGNARQAADEYLKIAPDLIDYKVINSGIQYPFGYYQNNKEVSFYFSSPTGLSGVEGAAKIDSVLYQSYQPNDLRKELFFVSNGDGSYSFRGKYTGDMPLFTGIATDEIYLIRAEANARLNNTNAALQDLNLLSSKRYDASFVPFSSSNAGEALIIILQERKKELVTRGLRWSDLKRLNKEPQFAITIRRQLGSKTFELPPNDPRYAHLIPQLILSQVDLPQNPR